SCVRVNPGSLGVRYEDARIAEHTVARVNALAAIKAPRHTGATIDFSPLRHTAATMAFSLVCHRSAPGRYFSAISSRRAVASSARVAGATFGYSSLSDAIASMTALATTMRVNHLLSAGTTCHGACSVAVCRIMSSNAAL